VTVDSWVTSCLVMACGDGPGAIGPRYLSHVLTLRRGPVRRVGPGPARAAGGRAAAGRTLPGRPGWRARFPEFQIEIEKIAARFVSAAFVSAASA